VAQEEKLDALEDQLREMRARRAKLYEELGRLREERERLNKSSKSAREQAGKHREERDRLNQRIKEIKQSLGPLVAELSRKSQALKSLDNALKEEYQRLPSKRKVISDLQRLEWEVSTTPTREMLEREEEVVRKAAKLRQTLESLERVEAKRDQKLDHLADKMATQAEVLALREEIRRLAAQSQEHHEKMILLYDLAKEEKKKADQAHGRVVEKLKELEALKADMALVSQEAKAIREGLRSREAKLEEMRRLTLEERREALRREALRKMESGEKLTLDELKLIYGEED